jgi:hypothetical protein
MHILIRNILLCGLFSVYFPLSQVHCRTYEDPRCELRTMDPEERQTLALSHAKEAKGKQLCPKCLANHPYASNDSMTYCIKELSKNGSTLTIPDGTVWGIHEYYHDVVKGWKQEESDQKGNGHRIIFSTNQNYLNKLLSDPQDALKYKYKYQITNTSTGESVEASLDLGPFKLSPFALRIVGIDHNRREIYLNNNSSFRLVDSRANRMSLQGWKKDDYIIIGHQPTLLWFGAPILIINLSAGEDGDCASATRLY